MSVLVLVGIDCECICMCRIAQNAALANPHEYRVLGITSHSCHLLHNRARTNIIDSGSGARKDVGLQVPPSAPLKTNPLSNDSHPADHWRADAAGDVPGILPCRHFAW